MLQERKENYNYSVSEISNSIKNVIEGSFDRVSIKGEISNAKLAPSGHLYFNLKDERSVISAICWKGTASKLAFNVEDGLSVICRGKITTYAGQSKYQLIADSVKPDGVGALMELLEKRKEKLRLEGLFDQEHKKPIPFFPHKIGVVTSPTGAVIKDILHRIKERFPTHVVLWPVLVQGEKASQQITDAINGFNNLADDEKPDVVIVARGGGSLEDLWCFNEENVARAVFASNIPIISAVGHETDTTLIDYVSDLRAPTPTAAAEKATPVRDDLENYLNNFDLRIKNIVKNSLLDKQKNLDNLIRLIPKTEVTFSNQQQKLDSLSMQLAHMLPKIVDAKENKFHLLSKLLESYSYKNTLKRGFAVVRGSEDNIVKDGDSINLENKITIEFFDKKTDPILINSKKTVKNTPKNSGDNSQGSLI